MCARLDATGLYAEMTYAVLHGQVEAGRERLCLYRRADGGHWLTLDGAPSARGLYVEAHAGPDWSIESLVMRRTGPERRDAAFRVESGAWRGAIQTDAATLDRTIPWRPDMLVVFDSIAGATLALARLAAQSALDEDHHRTMDVVRMDLSSLEPVPTRQQFEYMGRETLATAAGSFEAAHYFSGARHWWADARGIVVGATGYRLLDYHWLG